MTSEFSIAVHALVCLNHKGAYIASGLLAQNIGTNPARIRKIMGRLKKAGLIKTREGIEGGYFFPCDAAAVTLEKISRTLDIQFVSASWKSGDIHMDCPVASGMAGIMDGIYERLNTLCREALSEITIADIERQIFGKKP